MAKLQVGHRIMLLSMPDDPNPIPVGTAGEVTWVNPFVFDGQTQVGVHWDNGRTLMLCVPPDRYKIIGGMV